MCYAQSQVIHVQSMESACSAVLHSSRLRNETNAVPYKLLPLVPPIREGHCTPGKLGRAEKSDPNPDANDHELPLPRCPFPIAGPLPTENSNAHSWLGQYLSRPSSKSLTFPHTIFSGGRFPIAITLPFTTFLNACFPWPLMSN